MSTINLGPGNDIYTDTQGTPDTINGEDGNDQITGNNSGDTINGGAGNDVLIGGTGNDTLIGGSGNDILTGGAGIDTLTGGTGVDIFRDTAAGLNGDTITDFLPGDKIQITDINTTGSIGISGSSITFGNGESVTVENLGPGRLAVRAIQGGGVEIRLEAIAKNDFNGDGRSDILWRNDNGDVTDWLGQANGSFVGNTANAYNNASTNWQIVGTGDFNGDGRDDILWRNQVSGDVTDWLGQANGSFFGNTANAYNNASTAWHIAGTGDFNGDGIADILWRSDSGRITDWLGQANGGFIGNIANAENDVAASWHVVGTGDFNGDGITDILWQNDNGDVTDWLGQPNGSFVGNTASAYSSPGSSWHVINTGDFNGDGIDDILWKNDNGTVTDWLGQPNGGFINNIANSDNDVSSAWQAYPKAELF